MMGLGMGFGMLVLIAFWAVLILGGVWIARGMFAQGSGTGEDPGSPSTPREILDRRYARGEITREEYDGMRRDLER